MTDMNRREPKKLDGNRRNVYHWKEAPDRNSYRVRTRVAERYEEAKSKEVSPAALALALCAVAVIVVFIFITLHFMNVVEAKIIEQTSENQKVNDEIEGYNSQLDRDSSRDVIGQQAEEKLGMINDTETGVITVYINSRDGETYTADAGGN